MIQLITHVVEWIGLGGGGAWAVKANGKHLAWLIAVLAILFVAIRTKVEKDALVQLIKALPKP